LEWDGAILFYANFLRRKKFSGGYIMKKLLAIVLCLAMCLGILAVTASAANDTYVVAGSSGLCNGQNWVGNSTKNKMTANADGTYSLTIPNVKAGNYEFKIVQNGSTWHGDPANGGQNYKLAVATACDVTITFNPKNRTATASGNGIGEVTAPAINYMAIRGSGANLSWEQDNVKMTKVSEGIYEYTFKSLKGKVEMKFAANGNWEDYNLGGTFKSSGTETAAAWNGGNITFTTTEATDVVVRLNLTKLNYAKGTGATFTVTFKSDVEPEPEKTIKVHAQVPATWTKVQAYVWDGAGQDNAWPGAAMTKGADGWYTIEVPAWAKNIIINNKVGDNGVQTGDMALPAAEEVWIVVEGTKGTIYTTKPEAGTQPEIPELKIDSVGIRGDDTKFSAVNWNNDVKMTKTGEEGYGVWEYTFKNVAAGTRPTIKFTTNGGWDLNFGCEDANVGATSGTAHKGVHNGGDLWFEVKELSDVHIKLDLSKFNPADNTGATYTITVTAVETEETDPSEDPTEKPTQPEPTGTIIVHAQVPADWTAAYVYTWATGSNGDPAWPGAAMEKDADGWFTLAIPSNVDNIIINNGAGSQTQDMTLSGAAEIWITVEAADNGFIGTIHEENPKTADGMDLIAVCTAMLLAGAAAVVVAGNKKRFF
jgi:hypothetical protein